MNTPKDSTGGCCPPPLCSASSEAVQYADYILNHYARDSHADKLCLARDLERHGWQRSPRQLETDIAELNERLIDRQETLMAALVNLRAATRILTRCRDSAGRVEVGLYEDIQNFLHTQP